MKILFPDEKPRPKVGSVAWWRTENRPYTSDLTPMDSPTRVGATYYRNRMRWPHYGPNRATRRAAGLHRDT